MTHEEYQEFVLLRCQLHQVSSPPYLPRGLIEFQVSIEKRFTSCLVATQHRPDPRHKLIECEWFGDVIVSTQVQSAYLIGDLVAGSEHDNRDIVVDPQATADLEAVKTWHGDIQEHNVRLKRPGDSQTGLAVHGGIYLKALIGEAALD